MYGTESNHLDALKFRFLFIAFLSMGLNFKLFQGLYLHDVIIFTINFLGFFILKLTPNYRFYVISAKAIYFVISTVCVSLFLQILWVDQINLLSLYSPFNIAVFLNYCLFFSLFGSGFRQRNSFYFLFPLLSIPLLISLAMFLNSSMESLFTKIYRVKENFQGGFRYGGIFGKDVNSFGFYASYFLFGWLLFSYKVRGPWKFKSLFSLLIVLSSVVSIAVSGMRTGIIITIPCLLYFCYKVKLLRFKASHLLGVAVFIVISYIVFNSFEYSTKEHLSQRFSYELFEYHLSKAGHLRTASDYYMSVIENRSWNTPQIIWGLDSSLDFVDSFYVFYFIKYGFCGLFGFVLFLASSFIFLFRQFSPLGKKILTVNFVWVLLTSLKGIFVFNNSFMFMIVAFFSFHIYSNLDFNHE